MFKKSILLITGGTGSFGNAVLSKILQTDIKEIRIFSRDENKQDIMRKHFNNPKITFYIGDVRDYQSVLNAVRGVDFIFHAAALKQVPSCEFFPIEAMKTNIIGTENVIEAAINCDVKKVICLSTDKAVHPVSAMGISKALMEKVANAKARNSGSTMICSTRYGNVIASRGSVVPLFVNQIINGKPITLTDPNMTRFMMTLNDAVKLVIFAFEHGNSGDIFVQKSPATTMEILTRSLLTVFDKKDYTIAIIGTRHGEKLHEVLLSREEMLAAEDLGDYYRVPPDLRDLSYNKFTDQGEIKISTSTEYNSYNTTQLDSRAVQKLLTDLKFIQAAMMGDYIDPES